MSHQSRPRNPPQKKKEMKEQNAENPTEEQILQIDPRGLVFFPWSQGMSGAHPGNCDAGSGLCAYEKVRQYLQRFGR